MRDSFPFQQTKQTMERLAALVRRDLQSQIPQRGQNPYATGKLQSSLNVDAYEDGDQWTIGVSYDDVGNYTNFGTRPYSSRWKAQSQQSFFDLPQFAGYKKGRGGIRPQYWLSLSRQENKYIKELEGALELDFETFMNSVIDNLSKPL